MQGFTARRTKSQSKKPSQRFGKLTINTKCNHETTLPAESRMPELSFVSFEESKARKQALDSGNEATKEVGLQASNRRTVIQSVGRRAVQQSAMNGPVSARVFETTQSDEALRIPLSDRVKGLRPAPLDIAQEVSPADRAIPIGISFFSPSTIHSAGRDETRFGHGQETPVIVVTPAEEQFPSNSQQRRPPSSVYSRYTNCMPKSASRRAPPVPPLPLSINTGHENVSLSRNFSKKSAATSFEEDITPSTSRTLPGSGFSDHLQRYPSTRSAGLPTPRRSKGWWNIITSPFSARSTGGFFQRSPSLRDDHVPVLADVAEMSMAVSHEGVIFTNRAPDDDELRSAPARSSYGTLDDLDRSLPIRSETAPGALHHEPTGFDIYRIPSQGEAAAYYDPNRHFPSVYLGSNEIHESPDDGLRGWSPSHSVFVSSPFRFRDTVGSFSDVERAASNKSGDRNHAPSGDKEAKEETPSLTSKNAIFTTPTPAELKGAGPPQKQNERSYTQTTGASVMSPMSATPVIQDAHLGQFMGPQSSFGEQRRVNIETTPNPSASAATKAQQEDRRGDWSTLLSRKTSIHITHQRENSYGLGISKPQQELYPPAKPLSEKPRLGTDFFGQLTIRSVEEKEPKRPWYRRYVWYLAAAVGLVLVLLIVLLAVLIPRRRSSVTTETSWMDLTGFPALTIGVSDAMQTRNIESQGSCVAPSQLWSCAVPEQDDTSTPTFKIEIKFQNGTLPGNKTASLNSRSLERMAVGHLVRKSLWSDSEFEPSPAPPSTEDQQFLGRTTDNSMQPYDGEETPFYISVLDPASFDSSKLQGLRKRDEGYQYPYPSVFRTSSTSASASSSPTTSSPIDTSSVTPTSRPSSASSATTTTFTQVSIPSPALLPNGSPLPQLLYPLVQTQPLRLYNRNQSDEHYGFYTYFDRYIYITNATSSSSNGTTIKTNIPLEEASGVCTFSQTRFKVAIWTRRGPSSSNLSGNSTATIASSGTTSSTPNQAMSSSSYPITVTLDRHGGSEKRKGVYCYGIDEEGKVMKDGKMWVDEKRGADLVHPGQVPGLTKRDGTGEGKGIDGGTGGCGCQWEA
ncbi:hypothetical protein TI39_contig4232g00005 [Zymoseptoria brevis]|uniref:Glycoprotease family protein n=1 Tax=Zymoseptoria brevis TaxID=1047168 RepID=A0A0F4G9A8_9PEZI|nr:hypothetical protein TI39_contig4232g00005 [Zymoseptoria brevis]